MAAHTYNPSYTWKVEAGGSVVKRPDYRTLAKPYLSKKKKKHKKGLVTWFKWPQPQYH
jgi:hypothetical protein